MAEARKAPQAEARRARAVLLSAEGLDDKEVGKRVGFSKATAGKWRKRYAAEGIAGLSDAPRSGPPRTISDDKVVEVIRLTLETKPKKATHWSTRKMAAKAGFGHLAHIRPRTAPQRELPALHRSAFRREGP